ncbi:pyridoxamine 5'-phosphate oxidase family protein [Candidatus Saccharibacteria bacterium]|nr:pyridoxamine 5'-phosphate oxidase family protein [Candidatus Saccharibacteria bacterium]
MINLEKLVRDNSVIISTCSDGAPNIAPTSDTILLDKKTMLISHNEMKKTIDNIKKNPKIALLILDKNQTGARIFGKAEYFDSGKFLEKARSLFADETTNPRGAIVVAIDEIREIK